MEELTAYAKQKNVGIILWMVWKTLDDQFDPAFAEFQKWGVQGLKIDFMQRNDQKLINFYFKTSREAARHHMLVDFHGGQSQITMTRTWPNMISGEGVRGLEWSKWSAETEPQHNITLPFTRMFLGPMDFTPGAMLNATKKDFSPVFDRPMGLGTRCHQLGMYVVFESPLQMLSDSPSNYMREPEMMEFLSPVPSVWDDTKVLDARIAEYALVARKSGQGLVCRRHDQLDWPGSASRFLFPSRWNFLAGSLPGWSQRRPRSQRLQKDQNSNHTRHQAEDNSCSRRRLGREIHP